MSEPKDSTGTVLSITDVEKRITAIVVEVLEIDEASIKLGSALINDLEAEQGDLAQIVFRIEQDFGLKNLCIKYKISQLEIERIRAITVEQLVIFTAFELKEVLPEEYKLTEDDVWFVLLFVFDEVFCLETTSLTDIDRNRKLWELSDQDTDLMSGSFTFIDQVFGIEIYSYQEHTALQGDKDKWESLTAGDVANVIIRKLREQDRIQNKQAA